MSAGEQVFEVHRFQTYPQWIGSLRSSASALAGAIGARLMDWEEDGLGPAHGFLWRLPSDRIVLIEELEHLSSAGQPRIDLQVDLTEVAESGADAILAEALACFELTQSVVLYTPAADLQEHAREEVRRLQSL